MSGKRISKHSPPGRCILLMTHSTPRITKRFSKLRQETWPQHALISVILTLSCLTSCASVTIRPNSLQSPNKRGQQIEHSTVARAPDFAESVPFSWFGLAGTHHFNVKKICKGGDAVKIKSLHTLRDLLEGVRTAFFRLPKTAKIWCEQNSSNAELDASGREEN